MAWNATPPNAALAVGAALPALWTQQVGADLTVLTGVWTAYSPVVAGFGTATVTTAGRYLAMGKTIIVRAAVTVSAIGVPGATTVTVTLPFTSSATIVGASNIIGTTNFRTNAGAYTVGHAYATASSATFSARIAVPGAATPNLSGWTGAVPAGQVGGDIWSFNLVYESA